MRNVNYCRCVGYGDSVAVAKIIRYSTEYFVCDYCRDEQKHLNNLAKREVGISSKEDIKEIINLDNNMIYLCGIDCHTGE